MLGRSAQSSCADICEQMLDRPRRPAWVDDAKKGIAVLYRYLSSHCCDFYITKYLSKPMQNLKPIMSQMAGGMRWLEQEYLEED